MIGMENQGDIERANSSGVGTLSGQQIQKIRRVPHRRIRRQRPATVLEPAMILLMAGVVLFVVLAVLLPVFEMNQLVR